MEPKAPYIKKYILRRTTNRNTVPFERILGKEDLNTHLGCHTKNYYNIVYTIKQPPSRTIKIPYPY